MPETEAALDRFRAAGTQVLGVSVDTIFSHVHWGNSLGGVSFPLLADFHPKGKMAADYGLYLADNGISDRATIIIDRDGVVQFAESATPGGRRNIDDLVAAAEKVNAGGGALENRGSDLDAGSVLYIKNGCAFCARAMAALGNLHQMDKLELRNVTENQGHRDALSKDTGKDQSPCLVTGGETIQDSAAILAAAADKVAPLP